MSTTLKEIWDKTLQICSEEVSIPSFEMYFKNLKPLSLQEGTLVIEVPNATIREHIINHHEPFLSEILSQMLNSKINLNFIVTPFQEELPLSSETTKPPKLSIKKEKNKFLNPRYIFSTFVVGSSNRLCHAAALAVANSPGQVYNPFFIYGGVGLGKTHLIQAIGHHILEHNPEKNVCYVTSETFTNEFISSMRDNKTNEFKNKYRSADVLLVDDIYFFAGKEATQEEFFHTFKSLEEARKQIVLVSDRPPKELAPFHERLKSRFNWGLIADIQPPDFETRMAILKKKQENLNRQLPEDVLQLIANQISSNVRDLEGALNRIIAYCATHNIQPNIDIAKENLKDLVCDEEKVILSINYIQKIVSEYFKIDVDELKSPRRDRQILTPRQIAIYLCRELTDASQLKIGEEFGGRDHSTIINAHRKISNQIKEDEQTAKLVEYFTNKLLKS